MSLLKKVLWGGGAFTALYFLFGGESSASSGGSVGSGGQWDRLFEAFWQVAGREESRNRLDDWRSIDVGGKTSAGWLHFNQGFTLPDLFLIANQLDSNQYRALTGQWADALLMRDWSRSANFDGNTDLRDTIIRFLGSPLGEQAQKKVAYDSYFVPAINALNAVRPDADDVYRVVVASTRAWTSDIQGAIANSATADDFANYLIQYPIAKDPGAEIAKWRMPRQLQNARSMLSYGQLANT